MAQSTSQPSRRILLLISFLLVCGFPAAAATDTDASESYGKLPLHFEENRGQAHDDVRYVSRGSGYVLYLTTAGEAVFVLPRAQEGRGSRRTHDPSEAAVLRMVIVDGNPTPPASALDSLPGKVNYFIGKDPAKWRTNVPTYARVRYRNVYPGIDLVYYGTRRQLEYDFIVAPGADPDRIILDFQGADRLEIDGHGDLVLHEATGPVRLKKPYAYQDVGGRRQEIAGRYALQGGNRVSFDLGAYDRGRPLIIDPVFLFYSTYLGGERGESVAVDRLGHAYITGFAGSTDFTTTPGAFQPNAAGDLDVFVTKLNRAGTRMLYSTFIGGSGTDRSRGIAVDRRGNAYVTGSTSSADFPTTAAAFETTCGSSGSCGAAFVIKLNAGGSVLAYSTYLGGSAGAGGFALAVDDRGNAYVAGSTASSDFPTTPGAFQTTAAGDVDVFVAKLNPPGSGLVYSTYLGGSGQDNDLGGGIAVDAGGNAYVAGHTKSTDFPTTPGAFQPVYGGGLWDAFVTKLNATGSALVYSTYLGGNGFDQAVAIAVGAKGDAYVTGRTAASNFPVINAFQGASGGDFDAFVARLHSSGSRLIFSTYLGGSSAEEANGIAVGPAGNVVVVGVTNSTNFPTTPGVFQAAHSGGNSQEGFVTKVHASGSSLVYSTYLGGTGYEIAFGVAVGPAGNAYVTGETGSRDFPTTQGAPISEFRGFFQDGFVSKLARRGRPDAPLARAPAAE
jgi:Beta-propeller repeat